MQVYIAGSNNTSNNISSHQNNTAPQSTDEKIKYIAKAIFLTIGMIFDPLLDFFIKQPLADLLALETLRHGTSYQNYINIRINGPDPTLGGGNMGACEGINDEKYKERSKGYFHVSKDSEAYFSFFGSLWTQIFVRLIPSRMYCALSSLNTVRGNGFVKTVLKVVIVALNILLVPTIKFRFKTEDLKNFENDPDNADPKDRTQGTAYRTTERIGIEHIGFRGILSQGFDGDVGKRMKAHPGKVAWGLVGLIHPIGLLILASVGVYFLQKKIGESLSHRKISTLSPAMAA